ncbi:MAG: YdiU family protein [Candidatus Sericytochromatia bacterium]|nr:YdiU family protein [Candidatus Sericytochromatia bacterium]
MTQEKTNPAFDAGTQAWGGPGWLAFDNRFVRELPVDPRSDLGSRQVRGALSSRVAPTPVAAPRLLAHAAEVADMLAIPADYVRHPDFAEVFAGNRLLPGMEPIATNYGGHQFGVWAGQLGDGRAISLGECLLPSGERWELQLKGAGPTPYSRGSDGRAVLRSSVREFLCSEAMHHLGVPTTRALSLVATGDAVVRDMFYDGHPRPEPGAIVCRVAPSFIRFGHFELLAARGETDLLRQLATFTLRRDYPHLSPEGLADDAALTEMFREVCTRTARMVAAWMRVGFVHGVMNTDNMSILGLTIDYGPYGWLEDFDPNWTPNTTDAGQRRYAFGQQPQVALWNLTRLAEALAPLFDRPERLQEGLDAYVDTFNQATREHLAGKLGLRALREGDLALARELDTLMQRGEVDMTLFYRGLIQLDLEEPRPEALGEVFYSDAKRQAVWADLSNWLERYARRVQSEAWLSAERQALMRLANPRYVLRNYLAQEAIDQAEAGDPSGIERLLQVLRAPCEDQPEHARLAALRPEWARHAAGCSMLSCSS